MIEHPVRPDIRRIGLGRLFLKFLRFGSLAFGGPVAQIAMLRHELVEREHWVEAARFNRLLAVLQALPGPEAHELCVHLGTIARGRIGGILAGLGFMLPGFMLMMLAGFLYTRWVAGVAALDGILLGIQIAVLAIIVRAVARIGQHILEDRLLWAIAAAGLAASLAGVPFWIALLAGGAVCALAHRPGPALLIAALAIAIAIVIRQIDPAVPAGPLAAAPITTAALFWSGLKGGLLTFGGAYTAIPYIRDDTVGRGWLGDATFLDGVALAGILPAPLVIFATFVGYVAAGPLGALAITAGMFLPAFGFSLVLFDRIEGVVDRPALHRLLAGIAAAVVGIIAATIVELAGTTAGRVVAPMPALILFVAALVIAWRVRGSWVAPAVLAMGAAVGWAIRL